MRGFKMIAGLAVLLGAGMPLAQADTLSVVKERGAVQCGVTTGFAGFSAPDTKGEWKGLDVDMCRAVAAAVLPAEPVDQHHEAPLRPLERHVGQPGHCVLQAGGHDRQVVQVLGPEPQGRRRGGAGVVPFRGHARSRSMSAPQAPSFASSRS